MVISHGSSTQRKDLPSFSIDMPSRSLSMEELYR